MNRGQLRIRVFHMVAEDPVTPRSISAAMVNDAINDAYREIAMVTGALEIRHGVGTLADTAEYALPDVVSRIFRVSFDSFPLIPSSQRELDDSDPYHRTRTGTPELWTKDRLNDRTIRLYPIPTTIGMGATFDAEIGEVSDIDADADTYTFESEFGAVAQITAEGVGFNFDSEFGVVVDIDFSSSDVEVWAKKAPALLTADDDEPELPGYSHLAIAYSAAARVLQARTESRNEQLAGVYETLAQDYVRHLTRTMNHRTPERVDRIQHGSTGRTMLYRTQQEIPQP